VLPPLDGVFDLGREHRLSSYDAVYLALANHLELPVATLDRSLGRAAERVGVGLFEV
jgi:predicted nucleic acid-binding protein